MHLSIPSRPHYLPLRLQSVARDCNQGDQDHITCNYPGAPSSTCLYAREGTCDSGERLGGAAVSFPFQTRRRERLTTREPTLLRHANCLTSPVFVGCTSPRQENLIVKQD